MLSVMQDSPPPQELKTQQQYPLPTGKGLVELIEKMMAEAERERIDWAFKNPVLRYGGNSAFVETPVPNFESPRMTPESVLAE